MSLDRKARFEKAVFPRFLLRLRRSETVAVA